jgi:hypothetical protein
MMRGRKRTRRRGGKRMLGEIQVLVLVVQSHGAVELVTVLVIRVMRVNMRGARAGLKKERMKEENQRILEVEMKGGDTGQEVVHYAVDMMEAVIFLCQTQRLVRTLQSGRGPLLFFLGRIMRRENWTRISIKRR